MNYKEVIESKYNRQKWQALLHDIFGSKADLWASPYEISTNNEKSKQTFWLGTITLADGETIAVYEVELSDKVDIERNRRGIRDMLLSEWRNRDAGAFMFCYRKDESVLRFSYVSEAWNFADDGSYQKESTDTKRFTYLLGEGHRSRTAIQQFEKLKASSLKLKDLTKAFSVEAVSDMFFNEYKKNYEDIIQYITGKRMVKISNKWEEKVMNEPCEEIMQEFANFPNPEKSVRDYVKKLMGRLVFLQYLQKKGWLGVKNGVWGSGDPEFVQNLFQQYDDKDHFIDNVLEELFNELNTEHSIEQSQFKVPYLNGGLFEREATDETNFPLPAKYMQQMLDFFASYNFTIDENDPDDAEVGVDPEMLGRIFENLLEDNKDKGAFYTPKEIVAYMCRESLIAYLQTDIEDEETKEAIRQFVTTHEKSDKLPADTDQKLKDVKICDPAIGSGAFPMGLLKELFQCRTALEGIDQSKAAEIKKHIIQNNIYGVDIERGAVDIARLRFWLSLIVDEENPQALPNLDYKIVEGNSLITTFDGQYIDLEKGKGEARFRSSLINIQREKKALQTEQKRFFTLTGDEKYKSEIAIKMHILNTIWYQLDFEKHSWQDATIEQTSLFGATESKGRKKNTAQIIEFTTERQAILDKCEVLQALLNDETKSLQERAGTNIPFFEWETIFSEIFENEDRKGFDIVIGNPPYISSATQLSIPSLAEQRDLLISSKKFKSLFQKWDVYIPFIELGMMHNKQGGITTMIVPYPLTNQLYAKVLRKMILEENRLLELVDLNGTKIFENATVSNCIPIIQKARPLQKTWISQLKKKHEIERVFEQNLSDLVQDEKTYVWNTTQEKRNSNRHFNMNVLGDFCFLSYGLRLNSDEKTSKGEFVKADLLSEKQDSIHCRKLIEGKDIEKYRIKKYHFVEWGTDRCPNKLVRPTFPEFYDHPKIFCNYLGDLACAIDFHNRIIHTNLITGAVLWCDLKNVVNKSITSSVKKYSKMDRPSMEKLSESMNLCYLLGILNSKYSNILLKSIRGGDYHIYPEYIRNLPIPMVNKEQQQPVIDIVLKILREKEMNPSTDTSALEDEIDILVYHLYGLTYNEVLIVDPETSITREDYESNE